MGPEERRRDEERGTACCEHLPLSWSQSVACAPCSTIGVGLLAYVLLLRLVVVYAYSVLLLVPVLLVPGPRLPCSSSCMLVPSHMFGVFLALLCIHLYLLLAVRAAVVAACCHAVAKVAGARVHVLGVCVGGARLQVALARESVMTSARRGLLRACMQLV